MAGFEVRYLNVFWKDQETVQRVELSDQALNLEETAGGYSIESVTYTRLGYFLGIHFTNNATPKVPPHFILATGDTLPLRPIVIPGTDEVWWIEKSEWGEYQGRGRWYSTLFRTAGRYEIQIENSVLTVINNTSSFTVEDIESFLQGFQNSLWMLVLNNASAAKAMSKKNQESSSIFDDDLIDLLHEYSEALSKISEKPHMYLKEGQGKRESRFVKPLPKTFRELAINPSQRLLTSRIYYESYDTPENRYIHYGLKRIYFLVQSLSRVANSQKNIYEMQYQKAEEEINYYQALTHEEIDQQLYHRELKKLYHDLTQIKNAFENQKMNFEIDVYPQAEPAAYRIKFGETYGDVSFQGEQTLQFFVSGLDSCSGNQLKEKLRGTWLVIKLPPVDLPLRVFKRADLLIEGSVLKNGAVTRTGKKYWQLTYVTTNQVKIYSHPFWTEYRKMKNEIPKWEAMEWRRPLTSEEIKDRDMELKVLNWKKAQFSSALESFERFSQRIPKLELLLREQLLFFKQHGVKWQSHTTNSMVFIQNPAYVAAQKTFKKIISIEGLDASLLDSMQECEEIGLVSVPTLYERWCLVQILSILTEVYHFELQDNWETVIFYAMLTEQQELELTLTNKRRNQTIVLSYEKTLENGKRPDFMLRLESGKLEQDDNSDRAAYHSGIQRRKTSPDTVSSCLVLDAKFKENLDDVGLMKIVHELYYDKNYSENHRNHVFIMHPISNAITTDRSSPLEWGDSCNYGQAPHKGLEEGELTHSCGHIYLSPVLKNSNSLVNLQRLIGMFLQQHSQIKKPESDDLQSGKNVEENEHDMCCISCGNDNPDTFSIGYSQTAGCNDRYIIRCEECSLLTVRTVCFYCGYPRLFKNSYKWTYHLSRATQMSNIVCPSCQAYL